MSGGFIHGEGGPGGPTPTSQAPPGGGGPELDRAHQRVGVGVLEVTRGQLHGSGNAGEIEQSACHAVGAICLLLQEGGSGLVQRNSGHRLSEDRRILDRGDGENQRRGGGGPSVGDVEGHGILEGVAGGLGSVMNIDDVSGRDVRLGEGGGASRGGIGQLANAGLVELAVARLGGGQRGRRAEGGDIGIDSDKQVLRHDGPEGDTTASRRNVDDEGALGRSASMAVGHHELHAVGRRADTVVARILEVARGEVGLGEGEPTAEAHAREGQVAVLRIAGHAVDPLGDRAVGVGGDEVSIGVGVTNDVVGAALGHRHG